MIRQFLLLLCATLFQWTAQAQQPSAPLPSSAGTAYVIKAGRLIDPETGTATANQTISVKDGRIVAIRGNVAPPQGASATHPSHYPPPPPPPHAPSHPPLT